MFKYIVLVLLLGTLSACAFTNMGSPVAVRGVDAVSEGFTAEEVIQVFGVPDQVHEGDERALWVYRYKNGAYINYLGYYQWGSVGRVDVELEFRNGKVVEVKDHTAGNSWAMSILSNAAPGMIAK